MVSTILLVFALVLFVVSGWIAAEPLRWRLACAGFACLAASDLFAHVPVLH